METLIFIFGQGKHLEPFQMCARAIVIFMVGLILIRLSGRRFFGMSMPFDNVISILLGAILSRAVVGASPFIATICASATIVALYRLFAWIAFYNHSFGKIIKGSSKVLFENGEFNRKNMKETLITEKDMLEGLRETSGLESIEQAEKIYVERDGKISVIKK